MVIKIQLGNLKKHIYQFEKFKRKELHTYKRSKKAKAAAAIVTAAAGVGGLTRFAYNKYHQSGKGTGEASSQQLI